MGTYAIVQTRLAESDKELDLTDAELEELEDLARGLPSDRVDAIKRLAADDPDAAIQQLRGQSS